MKTILLLFVQFTLINTIVFGQFIENKGQITTLNNVQFYWQFNNMTVYFQKDRAIFISSEIEYQDNEESLKMKERGDYSLAKKHSSVTTQHRFDFSIKNSETNTKVGGEIQTITKNDFYQPHFPDGLLSVPSFERIKYSNVYPNIDLVFYQNDAKLKYEFIVHPGGDPSIINLEWEGVENLSLNKEKEIEFKIGSFKFNDEAPVSFSEKKEIETNYILENNSIRFDISDYNKQEVLIIDPALSWSSALEFNAYGSWGDVATNSLGQYYIVDWTWNPNSSAVSNYLASAGSSITYGTVTSNNDIIISKFDTDNSLLWACLYGGSGDDDVNGAVRIDHNDNLYIAGTSRKEFSMTSGDFPLQVLAGAFNEGWDNTYTSTGTRGYLLKFLPNNSRQWATYLDKGASLEVFDIDFDAGNNAYLVGISGSNPTYSSGIPSGTGYQGNLNGNSVSHAFIIQFSNTGSLAWATWLPGVTTGSYTGRACDIAINQTTGDILIAGDEMYAHSARFSTALITSAYSNMGQSDLFYMKFNSSKLPQPSWGGYIGGAGFDKINIGSANGDTEIDANGNLYLVGHTYSANFPTVDPGGTCAYFDGTINDGTNITANVANDQDGYLFRVTPTGTIDYSTFFGGRNYTSLKKIQKDSHENLWICGSQNPTGLATVSHPGYFNQAFAGTNANLMMAQLTNNNHLSWLSYYGFSAGYSGYNGFDISNYLSSKTSLYLAGKFNNQPNVGGGYQFTAGTLCSGAVVFEHDLNGGSPDASATGTIDVCSGVATDIDLTITGGPTPDPNIKWYSGSCGGTLLGTGSPLTINVSISSPTSYYVQYDDGCVISLCDTVVVGISPQPTATASATSTTVCANETIQLSAATVSGATYSWTGPNGFTSTLQNPTITNATTNAGGNYTLTVTVGGCSSNNSIVNVTVNPTPVANASAVSTTVCTGDDIELTTTTVSGATYAWTGPNGFTSSSQNPTISGVASNAAGTYNLTVTNNSCSANSSVAITVGTQPTASATVTSNNICIGEDIELNANTVSGATYNWTGPNGYTSSSEDPTISGATAAQGGVYNLIISIGSCASTTSSVTVTVNAPASLTITGNDITCNGDNDGETTVTATGNGPFSYSWSPSGGTGATASGLSAGTYTVTVIDDNSCEETTNFTINEPSGISLTSSSTDSQCTIDDGTATIVAAGGNGGFTYLWTPSGQTTATATGIGAGSYSVEVTDTEGCTANETVIVNSINGPLVTINNIQSTNCSYSSDGGAEAIVTGGTPNYSYNWSPSGETNAIANNLSAGNHTVTVTDDAGCIGTQTVTISAPSAISITNTFAYAASCGESNGSISITPNGGTPSYTYNWITGETTSTLTGGAAGDYSITITDDHGCTLDTAFNIPSAGSFTIEALPEEATIESGGTIGLTVNIGAGVSGETYTWTPTGGLSCTNCPNPDASPNTSTMYYVTVETPDGCSSMDSVFIKVENGCRDLFIPNMFSPNSDGENDEFCVYGDCITAYEISIFNRWGEVVYSSDNQNDCWDGTYKGKKMNTGVFVYKLSFTSKQGEQIEESGNINLIR